MRIDFMDMYNKNICYYYELRHIYKDINNDLVTQIIADLNFNSTLLFVDNCITKK